MSNTIGHTAVWARRDQNGKWTYADQQGNPVDEATANGTTTTAGPAPAPPSEPQEVKRSNFAQPDSRPAPPPVYDDSPPRGATVEDDVVADQHPVGSDVDDGEPAGASTSQLSSRTSHRASLRLVLLPHSRTASFPAPQNLAILHPNPDQPVSIGRDKLDWGHRIRVKDMEVSKNHATLFWKRDRSFEMGGAWYLVDNGSMYGTFVTPAPRPHGSGEEVEPRPEPQPERLSEPKKASRPWRLRHMECVLGPFRFSNM